MGALGCQADPVGTIAPLARVYRWPWPYSSQIGFQRWSYPSPLSPAFLQQSAWTPGDGLLRTLTVRVLPWNLYDSSRGFQKETMTGSNIHPRIATSVAQLAQGRTLY